MTGAEHYAEAERMLAQAMLTDDDVEDGYEANVAAAQVHATLALAAATALPALQRWHGDEGNEARDWSKVTA